MIQSLALQSVCGMVIFVQNGASENCQIFALRDWRRPRGPVKGAPSPLNPSCTSYFVSGADNAAKTVGSSILLPCSSTSKLEKNVNSLAPDRLTQADCSNQRQACSASLMHRFIYYPRQGNFECRGVIRMPLDPERGFAIKIRP